MGERRKAEGNRRLSAGDLIASAARHEGYSLREIRQSVRALEAMRRSCTASEEQKIESELSRGLVMGFEAVVRRADDAVSRLTCNHPKRRGMLDSVEGLLFTTYGELVETAPEHLLGKTQDYLSKPLLNPLTTGAERRAITNETRTALLLVRFLAVLFLTAQRKFPLAPLLALFWLLNERLALGSPTEQLASVDPPRVTRPPGQLVLADPRVTRGPGLDVSLAVDRSEGRVGLGAPRGSALVT